MTGVALREEPTGQAQQGPETILAGDERGLELTLSGPAGNLTSITIFVGTLAPNLQGHILLPHMRRL